MVDNKHAFSHLARSQSYLAKAAYMLGWQGHCIYSTALLHYMMQRFYPAMPVYVVGGWAIRSVYPRRVVFKRPANYPSEDFTSLPYAHYWLEFAGQGFDCSELTSRLFDDPQQVFLGSAFQVEYHALRQNTDVMPEIYPEDCPKDTEYFHYHEGFEQFKQEILGSRPVEVVRRIRSESRGMIDHIVRSSRGLLVLP